MAIKSRIEAFAIGFTGKPSAKGKTCYSFLQAELDSKGRYIDPTYLTYWTEEDLKGLEFNEIVMLDFELIGENVVVRGVTPKRATK